MVIITGRSRRDMCIISPQETSSIIQVDFYVEVPHKVNFQRTRGRIGCTEDSSRKREMRNHELFGPREISYQKRLN